MQRGVGSDADLALFGLEPVVENSHEGGSSGYLTRVVSGRPNTVGDSREPSRWNPTTAIRSGTDKARGFYSRSSEIEWHGGDDTWLSERGQFWSKLLPFSIGWNVGRVFKSCGKSAVRISEKIEIPTLMWKDALMIAGRMSHREIKEADVSDAASMLFNKVITNAYYGVDKEKFRVESVMRAVQAALVLERHNDHLVTQVRETFGTIEIGVPVLVKAQPYIRTAAFTLIDIVLAFHWLVPVFFAFPFFGLLMITWFFACMDGYRESDRDLGKLDEEFVLDVHGLTLSATAAKTDTLAKGEAPSNNSSPVNLPSLDDEVTIDLRAPRESQSQSAQTTAAAPSDAVSSPSSSTTGVTSQANVIPAPRNDMRTEGSDLPVSAVTDSIFDLVGQKADKVTKGDLAVMVQPHNYVVEAPRPERTIALADLLPSFGDRTQALELGDSVALPDKTGIPKVDTALMPDPAVIVGPVKIIELPAVKDREAEGEYHHVGCANAYLLPVAFKNSKHNEMVALTRRHLNKNHDPQMIENQHVISRWKAVTKDLLPLFARDRKSVV